METESNQPPVMNKVEKLPFYKQFTFADGFDIFMMIIGTIGAIGNGLTQPIMTLLFVPMFNSFGSTDRINVVHVVSEVAPFSLFLFHFFEFCTFAL